MSAPVLIVGSVAFDDLRTPLGEVKNVIGGAANHSGVAASFFTSVQLVGVVGDDYPKSHFDFLGSRNIDTAGVQIVPGGKTFHWTGYYEYDLDIAHTVDTQLGVFANFEPTLPGNYRDAEFVFLANIDPELQLKVLDQVRSPRLVVSDTMNFWIESKPNALWSVLKRVDIAFLNDAEARQLTGKMSTVQAAKQIMDNGPRLGVIIKKGEHGALLFTKDGAHFSAPSYPLEEVTDPTGAGDSFAGGFIGYVASQGDTSLTTLRRAVIYGSVMASYNVEDFSLDRMRTLTKDDINARYKEFQRITHFESHA